MTIENHIKALKQRHLELDKKLQAELARPLADEQLIAELKRGKLEIKDQLKKLETNAA